METGDDVGLLRLLVRNIPFILARPDVAAADIPGDKGIGASYDLYGGGHLAHSFGVRFRTLGQLARIWLNYDQPPCPKCGTPSVIVDFGGSFLSGSGKYVTYFCPSCGEPWSIVPKELVVQVVHHVADASHKASFIQPFADADRRRLPSGIGPNDLQQVFSGKLVAAYSRAALEEVEEFDNYVRDSVANNQSFFATFRLQKDSFGEVCFSNINGYAQLFGTSWNGRTGVPVEWDERWGLLPMLRRLAEEHLTASCPR